MEDLIKRATQQEVLKNIQERLRQGDKLATITQKHLRALSRMLWETDIAAGLGSAIGLTITEAKYLSWVQEVYNSLKKPKKSRLKNP